MNRYEIKDIATGIVTHGYEAEAPMAHQPEWGQLERRMPVESCSEEELLGASETYCEGEGDDMRAMALFPQTYAVEVTDISAEVEAKQSKAEERAEALQALIDCEPDDATTIAALRMIVKNMLKLLI